MAGADKSIVLFDGVCNLCSSSVQFIIRHDKDDRFRFASLQSETAENLLAPFHPDPAALSSIVLVENNKVYTHSAAALRIARKLRGAWPALYVFMLVPQFIRDGVYNYVARNRYKWFGRKQECWIPNADLRMKFLDQ